MEQPNDCQCSRLHLWSDAQVFNNGKPNQDCYFAVVLDDDTERGLLISHQAIGNETVNVGEYRGVIAALEWAHETESDVHVITDSQLITGHLFDGYRCSPALRQYRDRVIELAEATDADLEWKPRAYNKAGWYFDGLLKARKKKKLVKEREKRLEQKRRSLNKRQSRRHNMPRKGWLYKTEDEDVVQCA